MHEFDPFSTDYDPYIEEIEERMGFGLGFLAKYPHCLSRANKVMTRAIIREANEAVAVLSDHTMLMYNEQGERTDERPTPDSFHHDWSLKSNQDELWQGGFILQDITICAIVPAKIRADNIRKIFETFKQKPGRPIASSPHIEVVVKMIDDLRWLYLPITEDYPHGGIFVTRADLYTTVNAVVESLYRKGQGSYRVEQKGKYEVIPYPRARRL